MSWLIPSIPGWSRPAVASSSSSRDESPVTPTQEASNLTVEVGKGEEEEEEEEDIDAPPPFPLLDSHQRSKAPAITAKLARPSNPPPSFSLAPPSPPRLSQDDDTDPPSDLNIAIVDAPLGDMAPPPSTTKKPNFGLQVGGNHSSSPLAGGPASSAAAASSTSTPTSTSTPGLMAPKVPVTKEPKNRSKVALTPGHSALDWARLTASGEDLRGVSSFQRVTLAELKEHNTPDDAWSAFNGMVYNITPYIPFHPGGEKELMRVAGRDGTKLFMLTHSWVNLDFMMKECLVGMLVRG
ncbi:hypothetical protein IAU60_003605 [Kwoniella sp. DSM 27419]